jgi:integrase
VAIVPRALKWAVAEELLPIRVYEALRTVEGLRKGHSKAHETAPVTHVTDATVDATLPDLPPIVADMVRFQRLTGTRPVEVCLIRPCDVDISGAVWSYRPESHKTEHHGRARVIFIGPEAQNVLRLYLLREKNAFCFVPAESERKWNALKHEHRQSPTTSSQARRRRKPDPQRAPSDRYSTDSYRRAIARACETASGMPKELRRISGNLAAAERIRLKEQAAAWRGVHCWHPNPLRHSAATEIRRVCVRRYWRACRQDDQEEVLASDELS